MNFVRFDKFIVLVNGLLPAALLGWDAWRGRLGADPPQFAVHTAGMMSLIFLTLTLAVTPARKLSGWNYLSHFRRMLGLFAFFYGVLHLVLYVTLECGGDLFGILRDVPRRPFILMGMAALALMIPPAITSTNGMIRRLGAKRWKNLHRLVYWAAVAGVLHYWLLVKADTRLPDAFAVITAILLLYRPLAEHIPTLRRGRTAARSVA